VKSGERFFPPSTPAFQRRSLALVNGEVANRLPSSPIDLESLLHLAQQLYAHALTLQEMIWSDGKVTYEAARPKYDRQAAQQFEVFCQAGKRPPGFRKRGASVFG
jgi:hypothetical protein